MSQARMHRRLATCLLALAALFWSLNHVLGRAVAGHAPPFGIALVRWFFGALLILPFAWTHLPQDWAVAKRHWRIVLFLTMIGGTIFGALQYLGLHLTTAMNTSVLNSLMPVFIVAAAAALFGDRLGLLPLLGIALGVGLASLLFAALLTGTSQRNLDPEVFQPELATNLTLLIQGLVVLFVGADLLVISIWQARRRVIPGRLRPRPSPASASRSISGANGPSEACSTPSSAERDTTRSSASSRSAPTFSGGVATVGVSTASYGARATSASAA